jgi:hypothetical protein
MSPASWIGSTPAAADHIRPNSLGPQTFSVRAERLIVSGRLKPADKLPSEVELANVRRRGHRSRLGEGRGL